MDISENREQIELYDPELLVLPEEYDDCIVGIVEGFNIPSTVAYDLTMIIDKLMQDDMSYEDAWEHYSYNIRGTYMGMTTPVFITRSENL